jgi:hypothetical protein
LGRNIKKITILQKNFVKLKIENIMNSKNVLSKILTLLSMEKEEVELTYAKLADGTIVESPTFDVGEPVEVVSEDGTKSPAPDGEHELALRDSEGNDVLIKVMTKDGKITERENVELPSSEESDIESEMKEEVKMEDATAEPLTEDTDKPTEEIPTEEVDMKSMVEKLQYRIEELEKKMQEMVKEDRVEEGKGAEEKKVKEIPEMSAELPKLDGAPVEDGVKFSKQTENNFGKRVHNTQSNFLSKLYK